MGKRAIKNVIIGVLVPLLVWGVWGGRGAASEGESVPEETMEAVAEMQAVDTPEEATPAIQVVDSPSSQEPQAADPQAEIESAPPEEEVREPLSTPDVIGEPQTSPPGASPELDETEAPPTLAPEGSQASDITESPEGSAAPVESSTPAAPEASPEPDIAFGQAESVQVSTAAELKRALEAPLDGKGILLLASIELPEEGICVHPENTQVTLCGLRQEEEGEQRRYSLSECRSGPGMTQDAIFFGHSATVTLCHINLYQYEETGVISFAPEVEQDCRLSYEEAGILLLASEGQESAGDESAQPPQETPAPDVLPLSVDFGVENVQDPEMCVTVSSAGELKALLESKMQATRIYLGADISLPEGGICVHESWTSMIIDGTPPVEEGGEPVRHRLIDYALDPENRRHTIRLEHPANLLLCNMEIECNNAWGTVSFQEGIIELSTLQYENVIFSGPYAPGMIRPLSLVIDEESIVVETGEELKAVLTRNGTIDGIDYSLTNYTKVYLGADVTIPTGGITLPSSRAGQDLWIIGRDPREGGERHTLTESTTAGFSGNLSVTSFSLNITFSDMDILGRNYYSPVAFYAHAATGDSILTFQDVDYQGPQMVYNRFGGVVIRGTTKATVGNALVTGQINTAEELMEVNRVTIAGSFTVDYNTTSGNAALWFASAGGSLVVAHGASFIIRAPTRDLMYCGAYYPDFIIGEGATVDMSAPIGITRDNTHCFASLSIGANANVSFTQTGTSASHLLPIRGNLTVGQGVNLTVSRAAGAAALFYFPVNGSRAEFNDPYRVHLYNAASVLFRFTGTAANNSLHISAGAVNQWNSASNGADSMDNMPDFIWNKASPSTLLTIDSNITTTTLSGLTTNLDSGEETGSSLSTSTFSVADGRRMVFGSLSLGINEIQVSDPEIGGSTSSHTAEVRLWAADAAGTNTRLLGDATLQGDGTYTLAVSGLSQGDQVTAISHKSMLKCRVRTLVTAPAEVFELQYVTDSIDFGTHQIQGSAWTIPRQENFEIRLVDTRAGGQWKLEATLSQSLRTSSGAELPQAMVFRVDDATRYVLGGDTPVVVLSGVASDDPTPVTYTWQPQYGVVLSMGAGEGVVGEAFSTTIEWNLVNGP